MCVLRTALEAAIKYSEGQDRTVRCLQKSLELKDREICDLQNKLDDMLRAADRAKPHGPATRNPNQSSMPPSMQAMGMPGDMPDPRLDPRPEPGPVYTNCAQEPY